ncbi:MAG: TnsD family Tn7-like transposition protein [Sterolibacterium sp.]|nr:TnsD family Tn7-like transposition protein [Sterolibacterium sp.]
MPGNVSKSTPVLSGITVTDADLLIGSSPLLEWLPDETLFSLCSRHHQYWGYSTSWQSAQVMFGGRRAGTHHDLPSGLDAFVCRTDANFGTADQIARDRTLLRYYRPFISPTATDTAVQTMRGPSVAHLKFQLGLLTSRFRANHPLKACTSCMRDDVEKNGWVYWHLQHQFPGVWACPLHGEPLLTSTVKSTGVERFLWHLPEDNRLNGDWFAASHSATEALRALATLTTGLVEFAADDGWLDALAVQTTLRTRLAEKGWITAGGNARVTDAAADFLQHCAALRAAPELAGLPSNLEEAKNQIGLLIRPLRAGTHPLRLLVAIDWLFDGISEFIGAHVGRTGPDAAGHEADLAGDRPAVNASQDERRMMLVRLIRSGESTSAAAAKVGVDVATAQAWATIAGIAVGRRPKILKTDIRAALVQDLRNGADKVAAAGQHGISVVTVTRILRTEVGLHVAWRAARTAKAQQSARKAWCELLASHGALGTKLMRAMNPAAYAWLYRNDRAWLTEHTPGARVDATAGRASSVRWDERDDELSGTVHRVVLRLSQDQAGKPLRLWQIYQALPELRAKLSVLERLPLTKLALEAALGRRRVQTTNADLFK